MEDTVDNYIVFGKVSIIFFKVYSCYRVASGLYGITTASIKTKKQWHKQARGGGGNGINDRV